ncbi:TetR/AcrR family transcriptional regulator [Aeromonas diversa]|uniref:TetR family transcriptional regulator n=1 Tax=Aeromonas diversa CDC 2478-85 TaxID=1268237 RepID=N9VIU8_9GAMM|nr:TetR/AcrR family transcriptional regulator [Aeromonas diversa]ENY71311.1 TetR family transcriptional regulator [Aeromonas diversa CDC 2478-85]
MDKRERIFQATQELLAEKGFHGLSMSMVAKQASVATGTIYRYFSDKDDLLRQLHRHVHIQALAIILADQDPSQPPFEQYRRLWLNAFRVLSEDPDALRCKAQYEASPNYPEIELDVWDLWQPILDFFEQGRIQGLFIDLPPRLLSALSLDSVVHIAQLARLQDPRINEQQINTIILASWRAILVP